MTTLSDSSNQPTLSIGALSKATGIPKETIRTWERRYGFPDPARNAAGHRVYDIETVDHLRLISEAIEAGHRPGNVVAEERDTLEALLQTTRGPSADEQTTSAEDKAQARAEEADRQAASQNPEWLDKWMKAAASFDGGALEKQLYRGWNMLGGLRFIKQRVGPFLCEIGQAWQEGRVGVSHEHFASERLRDFLTRQWRPLSDHADGPRVVLANLPGEYHCLGLHMAAVLLALAGCEVSFLGADTPLDEIILASQQQKSAAVIISVSRAYDRKDAEAKLRTLHAALSRDVLLVVGGTGSPRAVGEEIHLKDWDELYHWAQDLARSAR